MSRSGDVFDDAVRSEPVFRIGCCPSVLTHEDIVKVTGNRNRLSQRSKKGTSGRYSRINANQVNHCREEVNVLLLSLYTDPLGRARFTLSQKQMAGTQHANIKGDVVATAAARFRRGAWPPLPTDLSFTSTCRYS